jgi:flagellar hook assembly protein FlgD
MDGVNSTWDGKNEKNQSMSEGTYYVIVNAKSAAGKPYEKQGYVTLVR